MYSRSGKAVPKTEREPVENTRPTALENFAEPLKVSVYGRPVTKGRICEEAYLRIENWLRKRHSPQEPTWVA